MSAQPRSLLDRTDQNQSALRFLAAPRAAAFAVVFGVILGLVTTWWWVGVVGVVVAGTVAFVLLQRMAASKSSSLIESREAPEPEFPRYHNLMEGLCISSGSTVPELRVIDEDRLNMAVLGGPETGVVIATTGLLSQLDRVELEGVLAEAVVRLRSHDAELGTQAAALVCGPLTRSGPRRASRSVGAMGFPEARAKRLRRLLGDSREFLADLGAVDITRYPPGLGAALEKMETAGTGVESATWGTAHLWLADPLLPPDPADEAAGKLNKLFGPRAPIDQRASLMAEL